MRCSSLLPVRLASVLAIAAVLCTAGSAVAQDTNVLQKVTDLNRKAVDAYENLEMEDARKFLRQALELCAAEGLNNHKAKARTHIHLGIVLIGGMKQRDAGIQQFKRALEIDPTITPTKSLLNPEIQAAFDEAARDAGGAPAKPEPPKPEPVAEPPKADEKPTASEGRPPRNFKGVFHEPVTESRPNVTITIKAAVENALSPDKVVLAYRPEGAADFLARDMEKEADGWWVARIPEAATSGAVVAYYIEARNRTGQALAGNGSSGEPHVISLTTGPVATPGGDTPAVSAGDEPDDDDDDDEGGARQWWLAFGVGSGVGYASGTPEVNPTGRSGQQLKFSGFAPANLVHISPEVGYFYRPNLLLSLQARLQFVTGGTEARAVDCPDPDDMDIGTCPPAKFAPAVLAKATWFLGDPGPFRTFVAGMVGGGEIRHLITVTSLPDCGPERDQICKDTILGGRILLGPGAGFTYALSKDLAFVGAINALAGLPNVTLNFDLNLGLGYRL